ncbi:hypothetical protein H2198_007795 [Neophaeococcomyces mojaviensis]|uniref:Uncharacterized protein n=1 Tax=Neophaeococcomyces mojaviensis TaxID=3383035 RepID=A0ACC2ZZP0_9EURO|nr:hypothetical protein H2198_007795 [Knufia sp. JES_112]
MAEVAPREVTPPPLQAPTAKERKYDRQLRLWAASGQRALEESHVLLVVGSSNGSNSSVAGAETLKNLILPGIGHFTIADSAKVAEADLGINFFLEPSSLGKSRAEETAKFLQELNPDAEGHFISEHLSQWLPKQDSLKAYNLILICAPIPQDELQRLSTYALEQSIPLVYIMSIGFYSTSSVQLPEEFPVVDTHPDPDTILDLRLLAPWPELTAAEKELGDLTQMPDHDHGHIPWLLILLHYLDEWKSTHNGQYPTTFKDKTDFRDLVRSKARTANPEGGEENFDEACAAVLKSISPPSLGSGCREMFTMPSCTDLTSSSANFWMIANAIKQFYEKHNVLPLPGALPDMKATSAGYIRLQTIYKSKARADVAEVTNTVRQLEKSLNRPQSSQIPASEIEQFCKNASFVRVLTNPSKQPLTELRLLQQDPKTITKLPAALTNYDTIAQIFLAMNVDSVPESTLNELKALEDEIEGGTLEERIMKAVEEVRRCQGGEMHNTSSVTGGMVAQEAIKLLTRQYVPVDGVVVWDGIRAKTEIVKV